MNTLGRIAYEAAAEATGCEQPWSEANQEKWEAAARAVAYECADECERMILYPGGRCEAPKHDNVWDAANAIRMRSNAQVTGLSVSEGPVD